ncbi:MAG: hypothetical protein WC482_03980 [Candidatus Omnitrophota bacterium]|nr:hypothetical protein [Candidatus Omnitrophota bacterium]
MKKIFILTQLKDAAAGVKSLRKLGMLHVENQETPKGEDINSLHEDLAVIEKAIGILSLPEFYEKCDLKSAKMLKDWRSAAKHLADSKSRYDQLFEYLTSLKDKISRWEAWGDFNPEDIAELAARGLNIGFYQIPSKELRTQDRDVILKIVSTVRGMSNCLVISEKNITMPYKELEVPALGLKQMERKLAETYEIIESIKSEIRKYACYYERFVYIKKAFEKELEFHEAVRGMASSGEISYLKGYIPADQVKAVSEYAVRERCGIFVSDPSEDDSVPTLIRNPRWLSIIAPVFKLIEVVPGYHELDISLWFLIFLSIFYGILIGDAAYGAIFLALTVFFQFKFGRKTKNRSIFFLFYILNICAVIWGILTGTFFGQEWLPQWVKPLAPALKSDKNVQMLCFLIGAVHLSIAHIWRFITKMPSSKALADLGWVTIIWGGFFLANTLILACGFPVYGRWLFIIGPILVILFTDPRKNILKGIASGLRNLLLSIVNSFTDVVSYIRLFAVGLACVAVADSFNSMAMDSGFGSILSGLIAVLILLVGHSLNIVLGPMSVLVHGVRLNVLEFCSHIDIKWSGFEYKPLSEGEKNYGSRIVGSV